VLEQAHPIATHKMCTRKLQSPLMAGCRARPAASYVPASVRRPRSVIASQHTIIGRPPACTVPVVAVTPRLCAKRKLP
jgi:hypothetical protein